MIKIDEFHNEPEFKDIAAAMCKHMGTGDLTNLKDGKCHYYPDDESGALILTVERVDIGTSETYYVWNLFATPQRGTGNVQS
jgi:hypothetical protein